MRKMSFNIYLWSFARNEGADNRYIGTYTQIVWAKTTTIGCGATRYKMRGYNVLYLVCNYGPTGNLYKQPVYETI